MNIVERKINLPDGRTISIETGKLAKQASGSVEVRMGNTVLLATVVAAKDAKPDVDFMPLTVEYKESFASGGRFPGGFTKREGRPGDNEILVSRLIDRVLRPLFPDDYHAEVFVTVQLVSGDSIDMPDALAGLAASSALAVSNIPFNGPISEVRVAKIDGILVINPTHEDKQRATIEMMVGATYENIMMVEGEMSEVSEAEMLEAILFAHEAIKNQCEVQIDLRNAVGVETLSEYCHEVNDFELKAEIQTALYDKIYEVAKSFAPKHERSANFDAVKKAFIAEKYGEEGPDAIQKSLVSRYYHDVEKIAMRNMVLNERIRLDGRALDEIRPIWCEVDYLPMPHGSAVFTRGETQSLTTVTLGTKLDEKIIDDALWQGKERFLLHYNFPPFSTGEARPVRGVSRREIGHGNLAHRALKKMLPATKAEFPYTVRVVSDILESNGSSSMATVCAGTLALMDAGVPLAKPVSGIAMGLISGENGKFAILSDILGDEDHLGDMDFKVTGTADGITACQMDIKVDGLSYEILEQALEQAKQGRLHILGIMLKTLDKPRGDYKPHAPRVVQMTIPRELIGAVIGPGGKIIQEIQSQSGTTIVIEENDKMGIVSITGTNLESIEKAKAQVDRIAGVPEIGKIYKGKVKSIVQFGAFIEIMPGKDALLHISEIDHKRIKEVKDVLSEGQEIEVKLIEVDAKTGKLKLSRKVLLPKPEGQA
ncbi:MAG: polyribonucleotide nucleotidyltransferase [Bacteroidota bacterium]|jgi:polyribonucleotide nucleotidyltransferase